jgi:tetratricopeptide (TPR) repeat protein
MFEQLVTQAGPPARLMNTVTFEHLSHAPRGLNTWSIKYSIEFQREALQSRSVGHPERAHSCGSLTISLRTRFSQTGDTALLDEALDLEREALRLRNERHPDRPRSCTNLAISLRIRFDQIGDMAALLEESIQLEREGLRLRPEGHPDRGYSCAGLANSLFLRFEQTGEVILLNEALGHKREALHLRQSGHPDRTLSCGNLAVFLRAHMNHTGITTFLNEALQLGREALRLRPAGHPKRATACGNLSLLLKKLHNQTRDMALLNEALELEREALRLRPLGRPERAFSCVNLAAMLRRTFERTGNCVLLDEARLLCTQAIKESASSPSDHILLRVQLAHIQALSAYSSCDPPAAVSILLETLQHRAGLIPHFHDISGALSICSKATISCEENLRLLTVYRALIEVLPEMTSVVAHKVSRLHRWREAENLPVEAFIHALKVDEFLLGIELLEQGRAVFWSQTLAMQGGELKGSTDVWKTQLQALLQLMNSFAAQGNVQQFDLARPDWAYASYGRLQVLLKEIRESPGPERFMRGPSYSELAQVASSHPVIILAADDSACHATIISSAYFSPMHLVLDTIMASDIENLGHHVRGLDLNVRTKSELATAADLRGIAIDRRRGDPASCRLQKARKTLWLGIVKPVLNQLGLEVRKPAVTCAWF